MALKTYQGSCHCGAVRFEADVDLASGTNRCNCSACSKARSWFAPVGPDQARLLSGAENQTEYQWAPPGRTSSLHYRFCKSCGVRTFGVGGDRAQGNAFCFVNVAALDGVTADDLAQGPLRYADGRNDRFNQPPADIRYL